MYRDGGGRAHQGDARDALRHGGCGFERDRRAHGMADEGRLLYACCVEHGADPAAHVGNGAERLPLGAAMPR